MFSGPFASAIQPDLGGHPGTGCEAGQEYTVGYDHLDLPKT
jgi:hypothetical protein